MTTTPVPQSPPPPPPPSPPPPPPPRYPARVRGDLDPGLSRWLWLVKWVLAIPHWIVLAFLWIALGLVTVVAFVAILVTGRYPRVLFEFTVGVLRWTWRVAFYTNAAFGTDRYPPFSLRPDPSYPADLEVEYPERLSRGLVLVKWWLLALPQYLVVGLLTASPWWIWEDQGYQWSAGAGGLVGLLALVGIVVHAVRGSYPRPLFDLVVGFDRWVLRVAAYVLLTTDRYPPFVLEPGPREPGAPATTAPSPAPSPRPGWTVGPVLGLALGAVLCLGAVAPVVGGATGLATDAAGRDATGFLTTPPTVVTGTGYAVRSPELLLEPSDPTLFSPGAALGDVRVRAAALEPGRPVFLGIAPRDAADRWLAGVATGTVAESRDGDTRPRVVEQPGGPLPGPPADAGIWIAQTSGPGTQTLTWRPTSGDWVLVVLQPDGRAGIDVAADAGATVPGLRALSLALLAAGAVLVALGATAVTAAVATAHRRGRPTSDPAA
ncbi:DUF4389 domain-containing protein [Actinomycetospora straminea]|uniref:DUF4389 domain-containing protein n=1 Tax=Actinomycetospora straminea TaxID=663607 RepID=A0ABP9EJM2_9PSEU|nr:DUF4389 domain-containing protein [Actinomycetospora straminea]MDD7933238.1 DUF4389 domain-containing protein [Actinomycetospora straminea]